MTCNEASAIQLTKSKENYHARYGEYTRLRRNDVNARDVEKAEAKLKKAQVDYKYSVEKYNNLRNQFVSKMDVSCLNFQVCLFKYLWAAFVIHNFGLFFIT
ncbi:unnamed protein product [Protopolystoma xenopodis]|uniref:F-BAR domain-containing protein n=1 Tax=Protopolystoma xenopodis TaxID=117903 RepID=A0A3S5CRF5_9PLAT|nr:unnamed protein product [Protopolystoma xenopodis]